MKDNIEVIAAIHDSYHRHDQYFVLYNQEFYSITRSDYNARVHPSGVNSYWTPDHFNYSLRKAQNKEKGFDFDNFNMDSIYGSFLPLQRQATPEHLCDMIKIYLFGNRLMENAQKDIIQHLSNAQKVIPSYKH